MGLCFSPLYAMLPVFSPGDGPHELWGNENKKFDGKLLWHERKCIFLCASHAHTHKHTHTQTMAGGNSCQLGPVEMSAYFISRSCCIYRRTFFFSIATISWTVREREREREREGALYPASRSMCSTFSGLYSSAVIQSVIFKKNNKKRSIYWELAKMFLQRAPMSQPCFYCWTGTIINWEKKANKTAWTCCCLIWTKRQNFKMPSWQKTHACRCTFCFYAFLHIYLLGLWTHPLPADPRICLRSVFHIQKQTEKFLFCFLLLMSINSVCVCEFL